jgi:hypothetical protein
VSSRKRKYQPDGFNPRARGVALHGTEQPSSIIRVAAEFAVWVRQEAERENVSITDFTRALYYDLSTEWGESDDSAGGESDDSAGTAGTPAGV